MNMILRIDKTKLKISNGFTGFNIFMARDFSNEQLESLAKWCVEQLKMRAEGLIV